MPPKKPAKPNAFCMFALEFKNKQGRKFHSLKDACDGAAPFWAKMSRDQRRPYEEMARADRSRYAPSRMTSEGLDVDELTRQDQLLLQADESMRGDIRNSITMASMKGDKALASEVFFVIHCNIFCYYAQKDQYYPAEIAVLAFTLKDGVKQENIFHYFVKPDYSFPDESVLLQRLPNKAEIVCAKYRKDIICLLPIGYKFEAKQISDETHQIKVPFDNEPDDNTEEIFLNLKAFMEKKKLPGSKRFPPVYAEKKNRKMIQQILNLWCSYYNDDESLFRVYELQVMFQTLRNTVAGEPVWPTVTMSDRELVKDVYAYVTDIACEFHSATAKPLFCSQSIVLRYAYVICDNCCSDLSIELEPGQHVPLHSTIPDGFSSRGSTASGYTSHSSRSSQYGERSRRKFDSDFDTESATDTSWDTESLISNSSSTVTTINMDDHFPSLGKSRSQSQNSGSSMSFTPNTSSSVKSYAGATVRSTLPAPFEKSIESMSLSNSGGPAPKGRGFRRPPSGNNSDTSSVGAQEKGFVSSSDSDFPPVGRGRGFLARHVRKPGVEN